MTDCMICSVCSVMTVCIICSVGSVGSVGLNSIAMQSMQLFLKNRANIYAKTGSTANSQSLFSPQMKLHLLSQGEFLSIVQSFLQVPGMAPHLRHRALQVVSPIKSVAATPVVAVTTMVEH